MSKKQHDYYYSFTSPPSVHSLSDTPSAPPIDDVLEDIHHSATPSSPPGYDEAVRSLDPNMPFSVALPPANKHEFLGYVRDQFIPSFNPSSSSSASDTLDDPQDIYAPSAGIFGKPIHNTGDYDDFGDQVPLIHTQERNLTGPPPPHNLPPTYSVYHANYQTDKTGVVSRDRHLNNDGEALAQFLQQHNIPPHLKIKFYGYHDETHYRTRNTRDKHGNWQEEQQPVTKRVDDFNFSIDCSDSVSSLCNGLYVLPDPKTGRIKTVRQLCDDYVHAHNKLKELQMTKVIDWDYARLTRAFTAAIRAHGYHHSICISYELTHHNIVIKTDSKVSRLADNRLMRYFMYLTCLWIFTWPVLWACRKKFGHSTLKSEWRMAVTERQWYNDHVHEVLGQIRPSHRHVSGSIVI